MADLRNDAAHHKGAVSVMIEITQGREPWTVPWPVAYEFLRVVTHPRIFTPPTPMDRALAYLDYLARSPSFRRLVETDRHSEVMLGLLSEADCRGNLVHDAHIAAILVEHGVREIVTMDEDFHRFPRLAIRNPLRSSR